MATIIDKTYFNYETAIPGIENPMVSDPVVNFINEYEKKYLIKALGYEFYKVFWAAITVNPLPTSGIYYDIVAGAEYECNGKLLKWDGLKIPEIKESVIAQYIYYMYMRHYQTTQSTIVGEVATKSENAVKATVGFKLVHQWNSMCDTTCKLWSFLLYRKDAAGVRIYPEFLFKNSVHEHFTKQNVFGI